jgi:hypothetical protein
MDDCEPTKQDLLDEIKRLKEELNGVPRTRDMQRVGKYEPYQYVVEFGSWSDAIYKSGISLERYAESTEPEISEPPSKQDVLNDVKIVSELIDDVPTLSDMVENGKFPDKFYRSEFGKWSDILTDAGFKPNYERPSSKTELLDEIVRVSKLVDGTPTIGEMRELSKFSPNTYYTYFGSWTNAVEEAGFEPNNQFYQSGKNNINWVEGEYSIYSDWEKHRKKALERDEHQCQICGLSNEEHKEKFGRGIHVHHIIPIRIFEDPEDANGLNNLITLCQPHHNEWEGIPVSPDLR